MPTDRRFFALFPSDTAIPQIVKTSQHLRDAHVLTGKLHKKTANYKE
jgi:hypothetical protein